MLYFTFDFCLAGQFVGNSNYCTHVAKRSNMCSFVNFLYPQRQREGLLGAERLAIPLACLP